MTTNLPVHPYRRRFGRDTLTGRFASEAHHVAYADEMHEMAAEVQRIIAAVEAIDTDRIGHVATGEYVKGVSEAIVGLLESCRNMITYEAQN